MIRGDRRVLVFSAHAADFCSRAGGTIMRLKQAGSEVHVYTMSYGEQCESPATWARDPEQSVAAVKAVRREEIASAAAVLGVTVECLDFGDSPLVVDRERQGELLERVRAYRPDLVLTHWRDDFIHPDHAETTRAVIWASRYCFRPGIKTRYSLCPGPEIVCFEAVAGMAPVTGFVPGLYVDISSVFGRKLEALSCFSGQPQLPDTYEILARYRGLEARSSAWMPGCAQAEAFVRLGAESAG